MFKDFKISISIKAFLKNGLGGFLLATAMGLDPKIAGLVGVFCGLSGSYTDLEGFIRNLKTQDKN